MSLTLDVPAAAHGLPARSTGASGCHVRVATAFGDVEAVWRVLEADAVFSGYQAFDWLAIFHRHLAGGETPCLAVISNEAGRPQALLPLVLSTNRGLTSARFMGGSHANFALGLWRPSFADTMTPAGLMAALRDIAASAPQPIDLFRLTGQPESWAGMANPFARLPHQPSPSFGYHLALGADADAVIERVVSKDSRKKLRKKERALAEHGPVTFRLARDAAEAERFTDLFLAWKAARFAELGIANVFAEPGTRDFILDAATTGLADGRPVIELSALLVGKEPVALFGGTVSGGRFSGMFNAMTSGPITRESPGELLLHHLIRHCCQRGLTVFDLGAGEAQYKSNLCDGVDPLFDQFIAMSSKGRLAAAIEAFAMRAKRAVKQSDWLWPLIVKLRRARGKAAQGR
jgi:CelD/BcsL family acetyltransferase involved in cellulose biosynthesis